MPKRISPPNKVFLIFLMLLLTLIMIFSDTPSSLAQLQEDFLPDRSDLIAMTNAGPHAQETIESIIGPNILMESAMDQAKNNIEYEEDIGTQIISEGPLVRSNTIMLRNQIIPEKDYLHLYTTFPFSIVDGSIHVKLPCDANMNSTLTIYVGRTPDLRIADLKVVKDLSKAGYMCLYGTLVSEVNEPRNDSRVEFITDIFLYNSGDRKEVLPDTSSITIRIDKLRSITK
ncbi:MAG: hypothetical protein ACRD5E_12450 [Nitrososphaeraceae archaeon]